MNQIAYFKKIIYIFAFIIPWSLEAKLLKPSKNSAEKEILIVNEKRRLYYPVEVNLRNMPLRVLRALSLFLGIQL